MEDYIDIARKIFEGTRYIASDEQVKRLADNMALLEKRGLGKLNKRLIDAKKHSKIFETIAEHNFGVILVSQHSLAIPISYEPEIGLQRPPDFKVEIGDITHWIQMKDLTKLERENRQDKLIQKIKEKAKEIKVGKFFSCMLSDNFKEGCLPELVSFIKEKATLANDEKSYLFTSKNNQKAEIKFWSRCEDRLSELTLGYAGDLEILEITGLIREQIKQSLRNAVGAFNWEVDEKNINLIVMEADNKEDIDICDAIFGTESELVGINRHFWNRENDGLFCESDFSKRVAGVIAIKRKKMYAKENEIFPLSPEAANFAEYCKMTAEEIKGGLEWNPPLPIDRYCLILYINDGFKHFLENIKKVLSYDMVVYYNMRPPLGQGNFECCPE